MRLIVTTYIQTCSWINDLYTCALTMLQCLMCVIDLHKIILLYCQCLKACQVGFIGLSVHPSCHLVINILARESGYVSRCNPTGAWVFIKASLPVQSTSPVHQSSDCRLPVCIVVLAGHLQSLDWTSGLDWWTDTINHLYAFQWHSLMCGSPAALFLATLPYSIHEGICTQCVMAPLWCSRWV